MTTTTRTASRKRTRKATDKAEGIPTLMLDGVKVPDVHAMKRTHGLKWNAILAAVNAAGFEMTERDCVLLGWKLEVLKDPSLKLEPSADAIVEARNSGLRWGRIALRSGIGETKARKLFEDATGVSSDASYAGRGRKFKPMLQPDLPADYKTTHVYVEGQGFVPKDEISETPKPRRKRTARRAKTA